MAVSPGFPFDFRVRLEGIIVRWDSFSVQVRKDAPTIVTLNLAPTSKLPLILPRTLLHIHFYDKIDKKWHLLFDGETTGKGRIKHESRRSFSISAQSTSHNFYRAQVLMANEDSGVNYSDFVKLKGLATEAFYGVNQRIADLKSLLTPNIEESFKNILGKPALLGNKFYSALYSRLKVVERIKALPDSEITQLFARRAQIDGLYETLIRNHVSGVSPILHLASGLAQMLYYDWVELATPMSMDYSIIWKPSSYFCPVPSCNVFFPNRYDQFSEERDWMVEPTRLILETNLARDQDPNGDTTAGSVIRVAPAELRAAIDKIAGPGASSAANQLSALSNQVLTAEEEIKGIVLEMAKLASSEWLTQKAGDTDDKSSLQWLENIADYKFFLLRFQNRAIELSHSFNPWVAVGFPGGILDAFGNIFGMVESVTHHCTVDGGSTSIHMTHIIDPSGSGIPGDQTFPPLPPWLSQKYATGSAYQDLLGSPTVGTSMQECSTKLDAMLQAWQGQPDQLSFAFGVNWRPIVTDAEFYAFLQVTDFTSSDDLVLSGGPFRAVNQKAIRSHMDIIAKHRGLLAP